MKHALIIASLLTPLLAFGQYPASPTTKVDLGRQTTGDGLTFRTAGVPSWTPTGKNNSWLALDTVANVLYLYDGSAAEWLPVSSERTVYPVVKNTSGVTLAAGTVVAVDDANPATGDKLNVVAAEGDGTKPAKLIVGVLVQSLANNGEGRAAWFGVVKNLSLSTLQPSGETWAEGDILYLSGIVNGGLTKVMPTPPALDLPVAVITRINGGNVTLLVRPQLGEKLGELHDVSIAGVTNGQVLTYNDTTGLWVARTPAAAGGISDGDKGEITVSGSGTVWTIDNDAVTAAKIATGAVGESEIATDAVTAVKIATGAVGSDELATGAVTSIKIGDSQVIESKIGTGAVTETKLGTGAVTETKIGTNAVTSAKIAADAVGTSEIAADAVTAAEIAAGAVGESELASSAVTEAKIANDAVTAAKIANGAVGTTEIADSAVVSAKIPASNITTDKIATAAVTEAKIASDAVTAAKIAADAVGSSEIAANAVGTTEIADSAVVSGKIGTGAVGAAELASTTVVAGSYTAANITVDPDGRITAAANGSGGGGTPAGSTGEIQYNNAGAFGASSNLFWDATDSELGVGTNTPAARVHAVGSGTDNTATGLLIEDSAARDLLKVDNAGRIEIAQNTTVTTQNTAVVTNTTTNSSLVIAPNGTGALIASIPDGASTGGNARGANAVDLQTKRSNAIHVASGESSAVVGGESNRASSSKSVVIGGDFNSATAVNSIVAGGSGNASSNSFSVILGGSSNIAEASRGVVIGGVSARAYLQGQKVYNTANFSVTGDAQASQFEMLRSITGKAQTELLIANSQKAILYANNRVWNANVQCTGVISDAGNGTSAVGSAIVQTFDLGIKRIGTNTSLIGTVVTGLNMADTDMAGAAFLVDADDTNTTGEALRIQFTPATNAGTTTVTRCHCVVKLSEVGY